MTLFSTLTTPPLPCDLSLFYHWFLSQIWYKLFTWIRKKVPIEVVSLHNQKFFKKCLKMYIKYLWLCDTLSTPPPLWSVRGHSNNTWHSWGGGTAQCHRMTQGGGGVKNHSKKCNVLFEWPLTYSLNDPLSLF